MKITVKIIFITLMIVLYFTMSGQQGLALEKLASPCDSRDDDYAAFWDHYYTPEEAYQFGKKIQSLVKKQDLQGIFRYIKGELGTGPRRAFALSKSFEEIFDDDWVDGVLSTPPDCSPVGWRGFMLGHGMIWYQKTDDEWHIYAINGAKTEKNALSYEWITHGKTLHPLCFTRASNVVSDIIADHFAITDLKKFRTSPGIFFGKEISHYTPVQSKLCKGDSCKTFSLIRNVEMCTGKDYPIGGRSNQSIWSEIDTITYSYSVIRAFPAEKCTSLGAHIGVNCLESYLVETGVYDGGTTGPELGYGIYGLFHLQKSGLSIVPLMFFDKKNDALNFIMK